MVLLLARRRRSKGKLPVLLIGSLTDSSTPLLPQEQPLDLPQTLEDVGQDMDQPFADNSGTTEVSPMTTQAAL